MVVCIDHQGDLYRARFLHAEVDHFTKPLARRPEAYRHDHYHVVLVTQGQAHFDIGGKVYLATPGKVYFTAPTQAHNFLNAHHDHAHYTEITFEWISTNGKKLSVPFHEILEKWTNHPCTSKVEMKATEAFQALFVRKVEELAARGRKRGGMSDLDLNMALAELLMMVYSHCFRETLAQCSLDFIREYIGGRYREKLSLESLAAKAGLTANYLSRAFKRQYGRTPVAYQIDLRMRHACELLRGSDDSLKEIAAEVGFEDHYYFARLFKKRMGESPGKFRRTMRSM